MSAPDAQDTQHRETLPVSVDALYRQYHAYVGTIALRMLGDASAADDIVQETFVSAYRAIDTLRDSNAARGWLARIAVRHAHKHLKRRKLRRFVGLDSVPDYRLVARDTSPEQQLLLRSIYNALDTLPSQERLAWTLRYLEGETLEAVAVLCDCSLATAKRRIKRAHETIQEVTGHA